MTRIERGDESVRRLGKAAARSSRAKRVLFEHGAFPSRLTTSPVLSRQSHRAALLRYASGSFSMER